MKYCRVSSGAPPTARATSIPSPSPSQVTVLQSRCRCRGSQPSTQKQQLQRSQGLSCSGCDRKKPPDEKANATSSQGKGHVVVLRKWMPDSEAKVECKAPLWYKMRQEPKLQCHCAMQKSHKHAESHHQDPAGRTTMLRRLTKSCAYKTVYQAAAPADGGGGGLQDWKDLLPNLKMHLAALRAFRRS